MSDPYAPNLDDPAYRRYAWARYRLVLCWMTLAATIVVAGAIWILDRWYGPLDWITVLAAIGGFGATLMLAAALMGLMFLSSGTGHDEAVERFDEIH